MNGQFMTNVQLLRFLSSQNVEKMGDVEWLTSLIKERVGIRIKDNGFSIPTDYDRSFAGGMMANAFPSELAQMMSKVFSFKKEISSFAEIGTKRGGTFFLMDTFLRTICPSFSTSFCVASSDKVLNHGFNEYSNEVGNACKRVTLQEWMDGCESEIVLVKGTSHLRALNAIAFSKWSSLKHLFMVGVLASDDTVRKWNTFAARFKRTSFFKDTEGVSKRTMGIGHVEIPSFDGGRSALLKQALNDVISGGCNEFVQEMYCVCKELISSRGGEEGKSRKLLEETESLLSNTNKFRLSKCQRSARMKVVMKAVIEEELFKNY